MLSSQTNMKYCNVTLDVGAAINAFKTVWHYPEKFKNVVIHLGDFHFMKENFQVRILSLKDTVTLYNPYNPLFSIIKKS